MPYFDQLFRHRYPKTGNWLIFGLSPYRVFNTQAISLHALERSIS